jgi:hypothetical protein
VFYSRPFYHWQYNGHPFQRQSFKVSVFMVNNFIVGIITVGVFTVDVFWSLFLQLAFLQLVFLQQSIFLRMVFIQCFYSWCFYFRSFHGQHFIVSCLLQTTAFAKNRKIPIFVDLFKEDSPCGNCMCLQNETKKWVLSTHLIKTRDQFHCKQC